MSRSHPISRGKILVLLGLLTISGSVMAGEKRRPAGVFDKLSRKKIAPYNLAGFGCGKPDQAPKELVAVFGDCRMRHWSGVADLAFAPDGKRLASASSDGTVKIWDMRTGAELYCFEWPKMSRRTPWRILFSPDGRYLAATDAGDYVCLVDTSTATSQLFFRTKHASPPFVAFDPKGRRLVLADWNRIDLWDLRKNTRIRTRKVPGRTCRGVAVDPSGKVVATAFADGEVELRDLQSDRLLATLQTKKLSGIFCELEFDPKGERLTVATSEWLGIWDVRNPRKAESAAQLAVPATRQAISPDGRYVAFLANNRLHVWSLPHKGRMTRVAAAGAEGDQELLNCVAWHPTGSVLAVGDHDGRIHLYSFPKLQRKPTNAVGHTAEVKAVGFAPDGATLASAGHDGRLFVWDIATGKERRSIRAAKWGLSSLCFVQGGRTIVTGGLDGTARAWDAATGRLIAKVKSRNQSIGDVAAAPCGTKVAIGGYDGWIEIWDLKNGNVSRLFKGGLYFGNALTFGPNGKELYAGTPNGTIERVNLSERTRKKIAALVGVSGIWAMRLDPKGAVLAVSSVSGPVVLVSVKTGKRICSLAPVRGLHRGLAFSPDGKRIAVGGGGTVYVCEADTGRLINKIRLGPRYANIFSLGFDPSGRYLATANSNGTVAILRVDGTAGQR